MLSDAEEKEEEEEEEKGEEEEEEDDMEDGVMLSKGTELQHLDSRLMPLLMSAATEPDGDANPTPPFSLPEDELVSEPRGITH